MRKAAFTLIELLVVIVIIGLLTSIATSSYLKAQSRSRDSARKSGINTIATGVEAYYSQKHTYPGEPSANTGSYAGNTATEVGCKGDRTFPASNTGYSLFYSYGPDANDGTHGTCTAQGDASGQAYIPSGTWIPFMGPYLSPFPADPHYRNSNNGQTSIVSTEPTADYLDSTLNTTTPPSAFDQAFNHTFTYIYRNLLNTGYATYARLENVDDTSFCGSSNSSFIPDSTSTPPPMPTCNSNLILANNTKNGSLPYLDTVFSSIPNPIGNSNPISVYILRK